MAFPFSDMRPVDLLFDCARYDHDTASGGQDITILHPRKQSSIEETLPERDTLLRKAHRKGFCFGSPHSTCDRYIK